LRRTGVSKPRPGNELPAGSSNPYKRESAPCKSSTDRDAATCVATRQQITTGLRTEDGRFTVVKKDIYRLVMS
jgi:hypothetical protein